MEETVHFEGAAPEVGSTPTAKEAEEDLGPIEADLREAPQINGVSSPAENGADQTRGIPERRVNELVVQAETCTGAGGAADGAEEGTSMIQPPSVASATPDSSSTMAEDKEEERADIEEKESSDTAVASSSEQTGVSIRDCTPSIYYSDEEEREEKKVVERKAPKRMTRVSLVGTMILQ